MVSNNDEALPKTRSEEKRWTSEVRKRLPLWVSDSVELVIAGALRDQSLPAAIRLEDYTLYLDYDAVSSGSCYVAPSVMLEFGARSTGEPASIRDVGCDASGHVDGVEFPKTSPRVMHAERTFWEKATAIHVFCLQERLRGDRSTRHWHDVVRLDDAGFADKAFADRQLANAVAKHKSMFFAEKAADRSPIDYAAAVNGNLVLTPSGEGLRALAKVTRGWSTTVCCSAIPSRSSTCSSDARKFRRAPTKPTRRNSRLQFERNRTVDPRYFQCQWRNGYLWNF
ncbi:hypothetical protein AMC79_PD00792 (plasmid) [Rhizobium phaseoli]|nr:hypothetical protein AMC89_PD00795 [Rhizobium phaseoli]ANM01957.1 hypothetical protein AMC79_PD00792 [Rhizobium phaseoli]